MKSQFTHPFVILASFIISCSVNNSQLKDGDIVFQTSLSSQSQAIQVATKSKYSHMGIVLSIDGKKMVYEAVGPVKYTPLSDWIKRGKDRHFVVKRLKNTVSLLSNVNISKLSSAASSFKGKPYDLIFAWSDEKIYCSEHVWKIYDRALNIQIGTLQRLRDFDLSNPLVKKKIRERYPNGPPMDEFVISPEQMFQSDLLETISTQ